MSAAAQELVQAAARLIVDEGLEYGAAKRRAARDLGLRGEWPRSEVVEDAVREHLQLFCADTQPAELLALRRVGLQWMQRLSSFRPYLAGAVWRGTATRLNAVHIELYCDDPKAAEIELINQGVSYQQADGGESGEAPVLSVWSHNRELGEQVTVHLSLFDHDDLRGALKPDARGRSWRGDMAGVQRLLSPDGGPGTAA